MLVVLSPYINISFIQYQFFICYFTSCSVSFTINQLFIHTIPTVLVFFHLMFCFFHPIPTFLSYSTNCSCVLSPHVFVIFHLMFFCSFTLYQLACHSSTVVSMLACHYEGHEFIFLIKNYFSNLPGLSSYVVCLHFLSIVLS